MRWYPDRSKHERRRTIDSTLRHKFLIMLDADLRLAEDGFPEDLLFGPKAWKKIAEDWRWSPVKVLMEVLTDLPKMEPAPMTGGVIWCGCRCHQPIGGIGLRDSCIHCR